MVLVQRICWEKGVGLKVKTQSTKCQMRDQGYNLRFYSKECEIRKADLGRLVEKASRTPSNVYILDEVKGEKCCMGQVDESCLLHRRMGHISFDNIVKLSKTKAANMPRISKPIETICKPCKHGKHTIACFKTKEPLLHFGRKDMGRRKIT